MKTFTLTASRTTAIQTFNEHSTWRCLHPNILYSIVTVFIVYMFSVWPSWIILLLRCVEWVKVNQLQERHLMQRYIKVRIHTHAHTHTLTSHFTHTLYTQRSTNSRKNSHRKDTKTPATFPIAVFCSCDCEVLVRNCMGILLLHFISILGS